MKKLVKMVGGGSWSLAGDAIKFSADHPFQLVEESVAQFLPSDRFKEATKDELKKFYEEDE